MSQAQHTASHLAEWLREHESLVIPLWIRRVRSQDRTEGQHLSTQDLQQRLFLSFYDMFIQAVGGDSQSLHSFTHELVEGKIGEGYSVEQLLLIPMTLKRVIWELATQRREDQLQLLEVADPIFDQCVINIVQTYTEITEERLNQQVAELDFLTRRLARSNEETEQAFLQLKTLYNISKALSSTLDIQETLRLIAENLTSLAKIDRCTIWQEKKGGELELVAGHGLDWVILRPIRLNLGTPDSIVSRAYITQKMQIYDPESSNEEILAPFFEQRDVLAVPLITEKQAIGVVVVDGKHDAYPFDHNTVNLVRSAAEQAAIALENALLYEQLASFNQQLEEMVRQRTQELEQANRELEKANRDLEKLDKTKSDFISIAAHELKTPLTLIQGYANILREDKTVSENPYLQQILGGILKGAQRLYEIIEAMIDVTMIDSQALALRIAPTSVGKIVEMVRDELAPALKERRLTMILGDFSELPQIEADAQRLYQVFYNVMSNAVKYTPDGGRITVTGRLVGEANRPEDQYLEFVVSDTGIGIDPEDHERIFDKFYQTGEVALHSSGKTKFKGGGPGLGLAIAKGIVEAHGGKIWVESEGHDEVRCPGSDFHILLPIKARPKVTDIPSPFSYARMPRLS